MEREGFTFLLGMCLYGHMSLYIAYRPFPLFGNVLLIHSIPEGEMMKKAVGDGVVEIELGEGRGDARVLR